VLEVTETSQAALALYRTLGFTEVREAACGERRARALRMEKPI
jgi:ribosomal protein S18 acetylase RimI-like enzyme